MRGFAALRIDDAERIFIIVPHGRSVFAELDETLARVALRDVFVKDDLRLRIVFFHQHETLTVLSGNQCDHGTVGRKGCAEDHLEIASAGREFLNHRSVG